MSVHIHRIPNLSGSAPKYNDQLHDLFDDGKPKEECGVFGIYTPGLQAARTTFFALFALQHRGQEGAGLVSSDGHNFHVYRGTGLVSQIFDEDKIKSLPGNYAIGHTRYSTTGKSMGTNTQPFIVETIHGPVALAHNGQLTQGRAMRKALMEKGVGMFTSSDSECIIQTISSKPDNMEERGKPNWEARISSFMVAAEGAYSCVLLTREALFAFRDPHGLRPLCIGKVKYDVQGIGSSASLTSSIGSNGKSNTGYVIASESCALSTIGAELIRDVRPGELIRIDENGISETMIFSPNHASSTSNDQNDKTSDHATGLHATEPTLAQSSNEPSKQPSYHPKIDECKVQIKGVHVVDHSNESGKQKKVDEDGQKKSCCSPSNLSSSGESTASSSSGETSVTEFAFPRPNSLPKSPAFCIFEYVYFARPDSIIEGRLVHAVRQNLGRHLAQEAPVPNADLVVGVPDSSTPIAIGYAQASDIPFTEGLTKNRYIARTFIQPDQSIRVANVELKYNTLGANLQGKIVVLVDDSIVRGTTSAQLVALIKRAGAKEVHVRIGSPPVKHPCFMGIDMRTGNELIASSSTLDEIAKELGADSLAYISHEGMIKSVREADSQQEQDRNAVKGFCSACFTGEYPLPVDSW